MAPLVKVLQIECIVPNLIEVVSMEVRCTDFELDCKDRGSRDQDGIKTAADPRNNELKEQRAVYAIKRRPQDVNLGNPGVALRRIEREFAVSCESSDDFVGRSRKKSATVAAKYDLLFDTTNIEVSGASGRQQRAKDRGHSFGQFWRIAIGQAFDTVKLWPTVTTVHAPRRGGLVRAIDAVLVGIDRLELRLRA
jgi:hypothetical protein